MEVYCKTVYS